MAESQTSLNGFNASFDQGDRLVESIVTKAYMKKQYSLSKRALT